MRKAQPRPEPEVTSAPAAKAPRHEPEADQTFGLGVLEPATPKRKVERAPEPKPEPRPEPPRAKQPEPSEESESDFGFGI